MSRSLNHYLALVIRKISWMNFFLSSLIKRAIQTSVMHMTVAMCRIFGKQIQALVAITKGTIMMKRAQAMGLQIPNALGNKRMMMTMFRYTKEQRYKDLGH